jgi:arginine deiminase
MKIRKVLYVEDDPSWRDAARRFFRDAEVVLSGGLDVEDLVGRHPDLDLVLLDFDLGIPEIDGSIILRRIRELYAGVCVGLFSSVERRGFTAKDAQLASFYVDKKESIDRNEAFERVTANWHAFMRSCCAPRVRSEWDRLQTVIVHTPASELRFVDVEAPFFLMEERPDESNAAREHALFRSTLQTAVHARVLDVRDLLLDVIQEAGTEEERRQLLSQLILDGEERRLAPAFLGAGCDLPSLGSLAIQDILAASAADIVRVLYEGWHTGNWARYRGRLGDQHVSILPPMNNAYFARDPGFALDGVFVISSMTKTIRRREARVLELVLTEHPWFKGYPVISMDRDSRPQRIEGGDVVALGVGRLAIGWSERTSFDSIKCLAEILLQKHEYVEVYAIPIPPRRAYMHLDTVFSLVGEGTAVVYPGALDAEMGFYRLFREEERGGASMRVEFSRESFIDRLRQEGFEIILTAAGDLDRAIMEQFADATNTLAVENRRVVAYRMNEATNGALEAAGIQVLKVEGGELVKGRGGPRCMTMPIARA